MKRQIVYGLVACALWAFVPLAIESTKSGYPVNMKWSEPVPYWATASKLYKKPQKISLVENVIAGLAIIPAMVLLVGLAVDEGRKRG